jgi:hypothetical protein
LREYPLVNGSEGWDDEVAELEGRTFFRDFSITSMRGQHVGSLTRGPARLDTVASFGARWNRLEIGLALDAAWSYWFRLAIDRIIPFFSIVQELFLKSFFTTLAEYIVSIVFGPNRISAQGAALRNMFMINEKMWSTYYAHVDGEESSGDHDLVMVGHGASGVYVKGLAMQQNVFGVAFEATIYGASPPSFFFSVPTKTREFSLVNVFSGPSLLSMDEPVAKGNHHMPDLQSLLKPANVFETFCLVAAGCVDTDELDHLCTEAVGFNNYQRYFRAWGRARFDDPQAEAL